ncbi:MAG: hypothetical protein U0353_07420 [Sandaracinus sp.]
MLPTRVVSVLALASLCAVSLCAVSLCVGGCGAASASSDACRGRSERAMGTQGS